MKEAVPRPAQSLSWVVEMRGVTLASRDRGAYMSILYPHAGLWALIVAGAYSLGRARDLMAVLMATGETDAEREVARTMAAWRQMGLIEE